MKRLKWEGLPGFSKMRWTAVDDPASPGVTGAFYKTYKNFAFYWILKAGHMVRLAGLSSYCVLRHRSHKLIEMPPLPPLMDVQIFFCVCVLCVVVTDTLRPGTHGPPNVEDDHPTGLILLF